MIAIAMQGDGVKDLAPVFHIFVAKSKGIAPCTSFLRFEKVWFIALFASVVIISNLCHIVRQDDSSSSAEEAALRESETKTL